MNSVNIIGRITRDIELRYTESQMPCVSMFVAINNGKDKDGNDKQADFPKVYVYDKQAETVSKCCHKGSKVAISGRIKTRTWDKDDGTKGYETYIVAGRVYFLDTKPNQGVPLPEPDYTPTQPEEETESDPFNDFGNEVILSDDDLPF